MSEFKSSDRIRRAKHEKNYTTILNATIQDSRLSWKARGLHHYILSLPNDWHICVAHLAEQSEPDGEAIVKSALKELEVNGYITKTRLKDDRGRFLKCVWDIYESPQVDFQPTVKIAKRKASKQSPQVDFPQVDKPQVDKPQVDKPQVENRGLISTNKQSTYLPSTEETKTEEENTRSENIYTEPPEIFFDSDLPENQDLISNLVNQNEETTPPTPSPLLPENVGLAIAETTKPKKGKRNITSEDLIPFRDVWNSDAPNACARYKELTIPDEQALRRLIKKHGNRSLEIFQDGLAFARTQKWWNDTSDNKTLSITNYTSKDKPEDYAKKYNTLIERGVVIPNAISPTDHPMTPVQTKMAHTYSMILEAIA